MFTNTSVLLEVQHIRERQVQISCKTGSVDHVCSLAEYASAQMKHQVPNATYDVEVADIRGLYDLAADESAAIWNVSDVDMPTMSQ